MIKIADAISPRVEKVQPQDWPELPFIGLDDIEAHTMRLLGTKLASDLKSAAKRFYPGDVLYSRLRPYLNKVWRADREGICSSEFIVLPDNDYIDSKFLSFCLNAADFVAFANSLNAGDRPRVDFDQISSFFFPLFSLKRQRQIVAKIEELFSELDKGIESLKTAQEQLKVYRQAVLMHAFEGKLTEEWRRRNPDRVESPTQILRRLETERVAWHKREIAKWREALQAWKSTGEEGRKPTRPKALAPLEEMSAAEVQLSMAPDSWVWVRLGAIAEVSGGLTKNAKRKAFPDRMKYLRVANVYANELRLDDVQLIGVSLSEKEKVELKPGDLLIVEGNGSIEQIGRVAMWRGEIPECGHQNHLIRARLMTQSDPEFILKFLLSPVGRSLIVKVASSTSGLHTLSISKVQNLLVPVTSDEEQEAVAAALEEKLSLIDRVSSDIQSELERAESLRQSILKKAFSGQLVPQDPNDEPASVLLERIKAEKSKKAGKSRRRKATTAS